MMVDSWDPPSVDMRRVSGEELSRGDSSTTENNGERDVTFSATVNVR